MSTPAFRDWLKAIGSPEDPVATDTSSAWSLISLWKAIYGQIAGGGLQAGLVAALSATSTTSTLIATGTQAFTIAAGKSFAAGQWVNVASAALATNFMNGPVLSYTGTTLTVSVDNIGGAGTFADWVISLSGTQGVDGQIGLTGATGATGPMSGPGVSIDSEIAIFNGVGGQTVKRATTTGLLKGTAGVLSAATADVDYQSFNAKTAAIVALTWAADKVMYFTSASAVATTDFTSVARTLVNQTTQALMRSVGLGSTTVGDAVFIAANAAAGLTALTARGQGKETIFIPAAAMRTRSTNGAAVGVVELATNKIMVVSLDFDTTTQEFAQFSVWFPKSWNLGTVTFQPSFSQLTTAAGGVVFGLAGLAVSSTDDLDQAFGTAVTSTTTAGTLNKEYQGPESAAITIAGTPAAGDRVIFQINRTVADGSDTLAQDARLHGVRLFFTTNAATDT